MEVRQMATAFLSNQSKVLMMKKARSKLFHFEFWGGIGGHLDYEELNSPMKASFREIEEETGFIQSDIENFRLKYILIESNSGEIRQQYVYFGDTKHMNYIASDEGELFWIDKNDLLSLHTSKIIKFTIEHYLENPQTDDIFVGTVTVDSDLNPQIQWAAIKETVTF
ncbi:NUDIX domain-containing protein [Paenibacillus radicis (ex Xue et al. 2023)]|uniref:NUDIX domain-containing protein n=1 Tax=Paenibacillus radicis (ex Xue et al. 2023) TaxID=2972489 RepID=A0ABT1YBU7_9BACL|nr:NUDIX domain-containing protein [Paenibacillus radicis (ex Xue et al. 2023)]MCR8630653.1 NUDIX domain-containing protein [Paenibacillus radicis (ex Xue et al. 2023)]